MDTGGYFTHTVKRDTINYHNRYHRKVLQKLLERCKGGNIILVLWPPLFHYKIESSDYKIRKLQADRLHLEVKGDHTFRIFFKGISVILESRPGVKEVENIRVILIIETYFKFSNKLLISVFMMRVA